MASWLQKPTWNKISTINDGQQYNPADGLTAADMNKIIENMTYLKKYGSKVNTLSAQATVSGTKLKLKSQEA